ncbi:hypothetical protein FQN54_001766 [Arachnomyces sp. PD_36]|nr:hypothetical protein FQN54_001766 [Arachnomyces sp. PD_36]
MAHLKDSTYYQRYLKEGKRTLKLIDFEIEDGEVDLNYGEALCRYPGCGWTTRFTTGALRQHITLHHRIGVVPGTSGGRTIEEIENAFCRSSLVVGVDVEWLLTGVLDLVFFQDLIEKSEEKAKEKAKEKAREEERLKAEGNKPKPFIQQGSATYNASGIEVELEERPL